MKTIAILMTCHNRKQQTINCLQQIYSQQSIVPTIDIYLTDDASTDGTSQAVKKQFPMVRIVEGDGELFWNRGMYIAWKEAAIQDYDIYMWLNDDTVLFSDSLSRLVEICELYENKSIIVGSTCSSQNNLEITYGGYLMKTHKRITNISCDITCDYFNGNIVLIPRAVYDKLGLNDPIFHHAIGDFDYGLRAKKMGIKSIVARGLYGVCDRHKEIASWCNPSLSFKQRKRAFFSPLGANPNEFFIYKKRHYGLFIACLIYISNYVHLLFPSLWNKKIKDRQ